MSLLTWNIPAAVDVTIAATPATSWLAAMSTCIDANSGSGAAYWEKAGYSAASPRYLILKRKSGAVGRLIFFGQATSIADPDAILDYYNTPAGGELWVSYSATSTSNVPDQSWLTVGKPLTATDSTKGINCFPMEVNTAYPYRLNYAEHADGFLWLVSHPQSGFAITGGGGLLQNTLGVTLDAVLGVGNAWPTSPWAIEGPTQVLISAYPEDESINSYTYPRCVAMINGVAEPVFRLLNFPVESCNRLHDLSNAQVQFFPIAMSYHYSDNTKNVVGQFRQIAIGPTCHRETRLNSIGPTFLAYGHAYQTYYSSYAQGIWFTADAV